MITFNHGPISRNHARKPPRATCVVESGGNSDLRHLVAAGPTRPRARARRPAMSTATTG